MLLKGWNGLIIVTNEEERAMTEMYIEEGKKYYHGNLWIQD